MLTAALPIGVIVICLMGFQVHDGPLGVRDTFNRGVQQLTAGHLVVGRNGLFVAAIVFMYLFRRARLERLAYTPGPVEVRPLEDVVDPREIAEFTAREMRGRHPLLNAPRSRQDDVDPVSATREDVVRRLGAEFREDLAHTRLYETTSVPGDMETDRIIEVFRITQPSGRMATAAAIWSFVWPNRAYVVSATLRSRRHPECYGVTVSVRRLPGQPEELETQWSTTAERALERAAFAVTAHLLPFTRDCRKPPWSEWRFRDSPPIPMELMRHYQRAKRMVAERRYDEALSLYHHALLHDADNLNIRFDIAQLYERLQLYADALDQYVELMDRFWPLRKNHLPLSLGFWRRLPCRRARRNTDLHEDPFLIRYRYVTVLNTADLLAEELLQPRWTTLRHYLGQSDAHEGEDGERGEAFRPQRALEVRDLRRRLFERLDDSWAYLQKLPHHGRHGLGPIVGKAPAQNMVDWLPALTAGTDLVAGREDVARRLLTVARDEAMLLVKDLRRYRRRTPTPSWTTSLTPVSAELMQLMAEKRLGTFTAQAAQRATSAPVEIPWPPDPEELEDDLARTGYDRSSRNWHEHYIVACFYAFSLGKGLDGPESEKKYARAAVAALERAQRCGDDDQFMISKRYWLLAGDPDLQQLRSSEPFRAFQSRAYLHPGPRIHDDQQRYEFLHYIRLGVLRGTSQLEHLWRTRAESLLREGEPLRPTTVEVEGWFRQERRAWETCLRLGRFHQQWQTRSAVLDELRALLRIHGDDLNPVPFPESIRDLARTGVGVTQAVQNRMDGMEELLQFLGEKLGRPGFFERDRPSWKHVSTHSDDAEHQDRIINRTRAWIAFAEADTRRSPSHLLSPVLLAAQCHQRAAVWGALRQWTTTVARRSDAGFQEAVKALGRPPEAAGLD